MHLSKVFLLVIQLFAVLENVSSLFKMTNFKCESINKSWVVIPECRLRAIKRDITALNVKADVLYPTYKIDMRIELLKKANGYKPFLWNTTVDLCAFMIKRNNPIFGVIVDLFQDFSSMNHTCPYVGQQTVSGFYLQHEKLKLPLPNGEYALWLTWYFHSKKVFTTNIYFTFEEQMWRLQ